KVEGRPDRRARGHPFSREILGAPLPASFREINLTFDGSSDPSRHVRAFEYMSVFHGYSDSVSWSAFLSTLRGGALDWFHQLAPDSIRDFEDFAGQLTNQYSSAVAQEKTYLTLMAMRQGKRESLRKYIARYNQMCLELPTAVDEVKAGGLIRSLRPGPCQTSLEKMPARTYDEVLKRCRNKEVTWPATRFEGPTKPRSNRYCRFHRDYGHTTEDCRHLKDEFERLTRAGHLKEFVICDRPRGKEKRRCREDSVARSDRDDDREVDSRREKRRRGDDAREEPRVEMPAKRGTIYMIFGGPTDRDSNNARKGHVRAIKRKREEVGITVRMPMINFRAEDAEGVLLPHNDALVITTEIAGFDVKRVFIDTGSSVDVMFYDCFAQINKHLNLELKPVATALYGFNGAEVMPMGEVSLTVALGSGDTRKVRMVRFVVVGIESSYNIILGRTGLNAFQAVVSSYHMMIKYPVGENVGEIAGDQLTSRRCYQTT
ncbi:Unknown protein, partial [Striga hermonthica]